MQELWRSKAVTRQQKQKLLTMWLVYKSRNGKAKAEALDKTMFCNQPKQTKPHAEQETSARPVLNQSRCPCKPRAGQDRQRLAQHEPGRLVLAVDHLRGPKHKHT